MKAQMASKKTERAKLVGIDWLTANFAFALFNVARYFMSYQILNGWHGLRAYLISPTLLAEQALIPLFLLGLYWLTGFYNQPFSKSRLAELLNTGLSSIFSTTLIYLALLTNDQVEHRSSNWLLIIVLFGIFFVITYLGRLLVIQSQIKMFKSRKWTYRTLIIGNSEKAHEMAGRLNDSKATRSFEIEGFISIPDENDTDHSSWSIDEVDAICSSLVIDQIIIAPEKFNEEKVLGLLYRLFPLGLPVRLAPDTLNFMTSSIHLQDIYGHPFVDLTHTAMGEAGINVKRTLDVIASAMTLFILSPLYLALGIWVKIDSKGPVFYRQQRIGLHQKPFDIIKFRTMRTDAEKEGPQLSSDDDPRITKAGRIMRKYRLDELPQFWNVLKGEMSLVGPRPEREFYIRQIMKKAPYYTLLHQTRPGITSWGMVQYGYASEVDQMVERSKYDLIYISNMSLLVDLKIMLHTVLTILEGRGK